MFPAFVAVRAADPETPRLVSITLYYPCPDCGEPCAAVESVGSHHLHYHHTDRALTPCARWFLFTARRDVAFLAFAPTWTPPHDR